MIAKTNYSTKSKNTYISKPSSHKKAKNHFFYNSNVFINVDYTIDLNCYIKKIKQIK